MMKTTLATLAAALMLAGCQVEAQTPQEPPEITAARQAVIAKLRDPESVRFADLVLIPGNFYWHDTDYVCGRVNAKNAFGGYTGFSRFVYRVAENVVHFGPPIVLPGDLINDDTLFIDTRCPTREWCAKQTDGGGPGCKVFGKPER